MADQHSPIVFLFSANRVRPQVIISALRTVTLLTALVAGFGMSRDVATAGVAALIAELSGAAAAVVYSGIFFKDMGGDIPRLAAGLAALQISVTAAAIVADATNISPIAAVTLI